MFSRLKKAITSFSDAVISRVKTRELKEEDLEPILEEFLISLVESDVAYDVAQRGVDRVREKLVGTRVERRAQVEDIVRQSLAEVLEEVFPPPPPDVVQYRTPEAVEASTSPSVAGLPRCRSLPSRSLCSPVTDEIGCSPV